jgi:putative transcriptional regulator
MNIIKAGTLLIAEPFLEDPSFARNVVLVCKHNEADGTVGFALNELLDTTVAELVEDLANYPLPLFLGGPVQNDTIHYIHQYPQYFDDAVEVMDGIYWGGDFEIFKTLLKQGKIDTKKVKFFLGYSGWDAGQLDEEMADNSWFLHQASIKLIFETSANDIWSTCLNEKGGEFKQMINYPINPQLN